jgi:hypothetical protein
MKKSSMFFASAVAAVALFFSTNVNAQTNPRFGVGINLGAPTSDAYSVAIGADLRYQFDLSKQLSVPLTAGYTHLVGKEIGNSGINFDDFGYIPAKVGLKYYFNESGTGVYGLGEVGAGFGTKSGSGTSFVYSPALGYSFGSGLDLAAKYEGLSKNSVNTGYVGIRLAYGFKL